MVKVCSGFFLNIIEFVRDHGLGSNDYLVKVRGLLSWSHQ